MVDAINELSPAVRTALEARVASMTAQQRAVRIQDLSRKTMRASAEERAEIQLLQAPVSIVPIVPPGQQVQRVFTERENDPREPCLGQVVKYFSRRGEGRSNREWHSALVMNVRSGGILELLVIFDAEEIREMIAPRWSASDLAAGGWSFIDGDALDLVIGLKAEVTALEARVAVLEAKGNGRK